MNVHAGEYIQEIESRKILRVGHHFDKLTDTPMSRSFDFLATYQESKTTRGFLMIDEGQTWSRS